MAYSIQLQAGFLSGVASSTDCVLVHEHLRQQIGTFSYATRSGSDFTFFREASSRHGTMFSLTVSTLASVAVGGRVLIDGGGGRWVFGELVNDGAGLLVGDEIIDSTARAAVFLTINNQSVPAIGTVLSLVGVASDGKGLFRDNQKQYLTDALATVGAITSGTIALVERGQWVVTRV